MLAYKSDMPTRSVYKSIFFFKLVLELLMGAQQHKLKEEKIHFKDWSFLKFTADEFDSCFPMVIGGEYSFIVTGFGGWVTDK